jgi:hypothetical protein
VIERAPVVTLQDAPQVATAKEQKREANLGDFPDHACNGSQRPADGLRQYSVYGR